MAYLVLLDFGDEEAALTFVDEQLESENGLDVKAIYKRPTMFHEPFETHGAKKTETAWTMGQKWGWWVCQWCKKPSRMYWESVIEKQSSFGKNLLWKLFTKDPVTKEETSS